MYLRSDVSEENAKLMLKVPRAAKKLTVANSCLLWVDFFDGPMLRYVRFDLTFRFKSQIDARVEHLAFSWHNGHDKTFIFRGVFFL